MDWSCVVSDNLITTNTSAAGTSLGSRVVARNKPNKELPSGYDHNLTSRGVKFFKLLLTEKTVIGV